MFIEVEKTELIIGNCSSYPHVGSLETSNLQSIGQAVIKAFRVKHRPVIPKFHTTDIEAKQETPKLNILGLIRFLVQQLSPVSKEDFLNCSSWPSIFITSQTYYKCNTNERCYWSAHVMQVIFKRMMVLLLKNCFVSELVPVDGQEILSNIRRIRTSRPPLIIMAKTSVDAGHPQKPVNSKLLADLELLQNLSFS